MSQVILSLSIVDFCGALRILSHLFYIMGLLGNPSSYISGKATIIQLGYSLHKVLCGQLFANMLSCILIDIGCFDSSLGIII